MAIALKLDGIDDTLAFPTWTATGDFTHTGRFTVPDPADTGIVIGDNSKASEFIIINSAGRFSCRVGNFTSTISTVFSSGDVIDYSVSRSGSSVAFTVGAVTNNFTETDPFSLNTFGAYNFGSLLFSGQLRGVFTLSRAGDIRTYDLDSSNTGAGNPVITDTTSGNNAVGVNMPTAAIGQTGSAWIDLGGSGITVTPDTVNSLSVSLNPVIVFNSVLSLNPLAVNSDSISLDPTLLFGGTLELTPTEVNSLSVALNPTIEYTSALVISPQVVNSSSISINPLIEFKSLIDLNPSTVDSLSIALNPIINYGQVQTIGTVTAGFADDLYSVKYKLSGITVNFKE